jgi:membrane-bound serine protease (ClpP class)
MAFQVLPLDWGSFGLILAGIFLLILEIYVTSYGLLSITGLAAFVMGSLFLFHGESGFISVQYSVIISTLLGVAIAVGLLLWYLWNDKKKQKTVQNFFLPIGAHGTILTVGSEGDYQVKVRGEIWKATSEEKLSVSDQVSVIGVNPEKLTIKIKRDN